MAEVRTTGEVARHRVAIAALMVILVIFLAPIYWITATAFKPRNLATTIPPTVLFEPEVTPFVKLMIKRSQLRNPLDGRRTMPPPRGGSGAFWTAANRSCGRARAKCSSRAIPAVS